MADIDGVGSEDGVGFDGGAVTGVVVVNCILWLRVKERNRGWM
jgi:multisubunit Na+/H+ antiporter MnhB subunit